MEATAGSVGGEGHLPAAIRPKPAPLGRPSLAFEQPSGYALRLLGPSPFSVVLCLTSHWQVGYYARKLAGDGDRRPLSRATVEVHHAVLHTALKQAVRWGVLG